MKKSWRKIPFGICFVSKDGTDGPRRVQDMIYDVKERVMAWYSHQNLKALDPVLARTQSDIVKPEELILLENLSALHCLPCSGGYLDQPGTLIRILAAAAEAKGLFFQQQQE